ncbi:MAG: alpha-L-fucosidase, partial [Clostridia bacterium]|nr:alpha-L-fucosidase [Clostridia bacterium]
MNNKEFFKEAKFGMMVHFGLYSLLGGEWKGMRQGQEDIGEWIQAQFRIPNAEYHRLASVFNPIYFDAEEWVLLAKSAGMKYIVVTSKHHDGFALFDSDYDSFNSVKGTPFGRDIIGELA